VAAAVLSGLPLYVPGHRNPYGDVQQLPSFCQNLIASSEGSTCRRFHNALNEEATRHPHGVIGTCPAGLSCFALRLGEQRIGGGHVRCNGHVPPKEVALFQQVPEMAKERLQALLESLPVLLGASGDVLSRLQPEVKRLLSQRQPLENALAQLCELLVRADVCDDALIGSWVEGDLRWGASAGARSPEAAQKLWQSACKGQVRRTYSPQQLKKLGLKGEVGLVLPLGEEELQGMILLAWHRPMSPQLLAGDRQFTSGLLLAVESARLIEIAARETRSLEEGRRYAAASLAQVGAALASALNLQELQRLVLEVFIRLAQVDGGQIVLLDQQDARSTHQIGVEAGSSTLFLPLVRHDQVKAHLRLVSKKARVYTPEELSLLESFASQAAMAIENAQLFEWEQEKAREATALLRAARAIEEGHDLDEVLEHSALALAQLAEVNRCLILLKDHQKPQFAVVAATGLSSDQEEFFSAFRLHVTQLSEQVREELQEGRPVVYNQGITEESGLERLCSLLPSSACMILPLVVKERLIGLIYLDDSRGAHHFAPSLVRLVSTLALQVGNAIQRASLINQLQENLGPLKALYHVSTAITGTLSLSKVVRLIVDQAVDLLEHSACALLVLDEMGEGFRLETSVGVADEMLDPALQARMARLAVERKRAVALYLDKDPECEEIREPLSRGKFGGLLSVPLIARKKMVGVLNCYVPAGFRFRQQEIRFLRGFANQAAIAVENARLHGMIRFKMGELGTLFEVSKAVTSTLQLDRVLEEIVRHVREILRADACSLMLVEGANLIMKTAEGIELCATKPIALGRGVAGVAAKTGQPMILLDRPEHPEDEFPQSVRTQGLKTILSVPIETRGRVIGLINVYYREFMSHTPAQINLLTALGSQAAVAIENARLYADKERTTELLRSVLIPRERLEFPQLTVGHRFIPSQDLSGDYYDLIPLGLKRCALIIADVAGKGADAAIQTVRAKQVLHSYATAGYSPAQSLSMLNQQLGGEDNARQVTVFYAEVDLENRKLQFACAGHEPGIFWGPGIEPRTLDAEGIMIGAIQDADYHDVTVDIPEGSWLLLYTDGCTEARNPDGDFFGLNRVLEVVREHQGNSAQRLVNSLYTRVRKFTREKITDDFSVMAVRF